MDKPLSLIKSLMSRKANEFSEISQVYFRAGRKELTKLMNRLSSSLLDEVAKPDLCKRYIDDCVGATSSCREELNIHTYIHIYLHTYIHTYIHTHIHATGLNNVCACAISHDNKAKFSART